MSAKKIKLSFFLIGPFGREKPNVILSIAVFGKKEIIVKIKQIIKKKRLIYDKGVKLFEKSFIKVN
jgi:hypothetical protein